jgi:heme A synthase
MIGTSTEQTSKQEKSRGSEFYPKYAWAVLVYNVAVILWGAYVRASGSGAGCGGHWPLCNGEMIPASPGTAMLIEFSHRLTSGLTLPLVVGLALWAWWAYPKGHPVRLGANLAVLFTITEALVGAGLVLFGLTADNDSMARAFGIAIHLTNTFLLLASLALAAFWGSGGKPIQMRGQGKLNWFLALGLLGVLVLGITGAVTALGDTLFPASSLAQGLEQDLNPTTQLLVRLRVLHPFIAITVGIYVVLLARVLSAFRASTEVRFWAVATTALVAVQWVAGIMNIYLLAPIWLQLVHLLLADLIWIALVLLAATVLGQSIPEAKTGEPLKRLWRALVSTD